MATEVPEEYHRNAHPEQQVSPEAAASLWYGSTFWPDIRSVSVDQTARWLASGWGDLMTAPGISLSYGSVFAAIAWLMGGGLFAVGMESLLAPLVAGFMLVAPFAAVGFYEISRLHEQNEPVTFMDTLRVYKRSGPQLGAIGMALTVALMIWFVVSLVLFAIFFGTSPPNMNNFIGSLLESPQAIPFLSVGTLLGGLIAAGVFAISAVSLPMVVDGNTSALVAMITSVRAVHGNKHAMIGWAAAIVLITGVGIATFFIGLIVTFPLIGHASWHAYKATVGAQRDHEIPVEPTEW